MSGVGFMFGFTGDDLVTGAKAALAGTPGCVHHICAPIPAPVKLVGGAAVCTAGAIKYGRSAHTTVIDLKNEASAVVNRHKIKSRTTGSTLLPDAAYPCFRDSKDDMIYRVILDSAPMRDLLDCATMPLEAKNIYEIKLVTKTVDKPEQTMESKVWIHLGDVVERPKKIYEARGPPAVACLESAGPMLKWHGVPADEVEPTDEGYREIARGVLGHDLERNIETEWKGVNEESVWSWQEQTGPPDMVLRIPEENLTVEVGPSLEAFECTPQGHRELAAAYRKLQNNTVAISRASKELDRELEKIRIDRDLKLQLLAAAEVAKEEQAEKHYVEVKDLKDAHAVHRDELESQVEDLAQRTERALEINQQQRELHESELKQTAEKQRQYHLEQMSAAQAEMDELKKKHEESICSAENDLRDMTETLGEQETKLECLPWSHDFEIAALREAHRQEVEALEERLANAKQTTVVTIQYEIPNPPLLIRDKDGYEYVEDDTEGAYDDDHDWWVDDTVPRIVPRPSLTQEHSRISSLEAWVSGTLVSPEKSIAADPHTISVCTLHQGAQWCVQLNIVVMSFKAFDGRSVTFMARHSWQAIEGLQNKGYDMYLYNIGRKKFIGKMGKNCPFMWPTMENKQLKATYAVEDSSPLIKDNLVDIHMNYAKGKPNKNEFKVHDVMLIDIPWPGSSLQTKAMPVELATTALGCMGRMRAVDNFNQQFNGITEGEIPNYPWNRDLVEQCGIFCHRIFNEKGGSSSVVWCGERQILGVYCGAYGTHDGIMYNYAIHFSVLKKMLGKHLDVDVSPPLVRGQEQFGNEMQRILEMFQNQLEEAASFGVTHVNEAILEKFTMGLDDILGFPVEMEFEIPEGDEDEGDLQAMPTVDEAHPGPQLETVTAEKARGGRAQTKSKDGRTKMRVAEQAQRAQDFGSRKRPFNAKDGGSAPTANNKAALVRKKILGVAYQANKADIGHLISHIKGIRHEFTGKQYGAMQDHLYHFLREGDDPQWNDRYQEEEEERRQREADEDAWEDEHEDDFNMEGRGARGSADVDQTNVHGEKIHGGKATGESKPWAPPKMAKGLREIDTNLRARYAKAPKLSYDGVHGQFDTGPDGPSDGALRAFDVCQLECFFLYSFNIDPKAATLVDQPEPKKFEDTYEDCLPAVTEPNRPLKELMPKFNAPEKESASSSEPRSSLEAPRACDVPNVRPRLERLPRDRKATCSKTGGHPPSWAIKPANFDLAATLCNAAVVIPSTTKDESSLFDHKFGGPTEKWVEAPPMEGELESQKNLAVYEVGLNQTEEYDDIEYATTTKQCRPMMTAPNEDVERFDALIWKITSKSADITIGELCEELDAFGKLYGIPKESFYYKQFIKPHIVEASKKADQAEIINHCTALAEAPRHLKTSGGDKSDMQPAFEGLMKEFKDINWDEQANESKAVMPPTQEKHIRESLNSQLKGKEGKPLDKRVAHLMAAGHPAAEWDRDEPFFGYMQRMFQDITTSKGVGWYNGPTVSNKGDYLATGSAQHETLTRFVLYCLYDLNTLCFATPWDLFHAGIILPEILKIKDEPHARKKVNSKRWRLIWQTCISIECTTRMVHGLQNKAEISAYQADLTHTDAFFFFGGAAGMGHSDECMLKTKQAIRRMLGESGCGPLQGDRKSWDMSCTRHMWMAEGQLRAQLAFAGGAPDAIVRAQLVMSIALSSHLIMVGGFIYQVDVFGIMGSGVLSTACSNGHMNQLTQFDAGLAHAATFYAAAEFVAFTWRCFFVAVETALAFEVFFSYRSLCMGDDSVGAYTPEGDDMVAYVAHMASLNITVTGQDKDTLPTAAPMESVDFTSHKYDLTNDDPGLFQNHAKLSWRLALMQQSNKSLKQDQAHGVLFATRHLEWFQEPLLRMIATLNPDLADMRYVPGLGYNLETFL